MIQNGEMKLIKKAEIIFPPFMYRPYVISFSMSVWHNVNEELVIFHAL